MPRTARSQRRTRRSGICGQALLNDFGQVAIRIRTIFQIRGPVVVLREVVNYVSGVVIDEIEIVVAKLLNNLPERGLVFLVGLAVAAAVPGIG